MGQGDCVTHSLTPALPNWRGTYLQCTCVLTCLEHTHIELPRRVHLLFTAQREAAHPFVLCVPEPRLHGAHPFGIHQLPSRGVELPPHHINRPIGSVWRAPLAELHLALRTAP